MRLEASARKERASTCDVIWYEFIYILMTVQKLNVLVQKKSAGIAFCKNQREPVPKTTKIRVKIVKSKKMKKTEHRGILLMKGFPKPCRSTSGSKN